MQGGGPPGGPRGGGPPGHNGHFGGGPPNSNQGGFFPGGPRGPRGGGGGGMWGGPGEGSSQGCWSPVALHCNCCTTVNFVGWNTAKGILRNVFGLPLARVRCLVVWWPGKGWRLRTLYRHALSILLECLVLRSYKTSRLLDTHRFEFTFSIQLQTSILKQYTLHPFLPVASFCTPFTFLHGSLSLSSILRILNTHANLRPRRGGAGMGPRPGMGPHGGPGPRGPGWGRPGMGPGETTTRVSNSFCVFDKPVVK